MNGRALRALVVDDSAVVRQFMTALLSREPDIRVQTAADPLIALEKMKLERPDVILLDLEMPRMDGLTFLRRIMRENPIPVVVCSGFAGRGTERALQALEEGAVDVLAKPQLGLRDFLRESSVRLVDTLRAAAQARVPRPDSAPADVRSPGAGVAPRHSPSFPGRVVVMGASTGGTEAVLRVLEAMPADAPPILIVQHMPETFTAAFAARLDRLCEIRVSEAVDGSPVVEGQALVAPGNRHMELVATESGPTIRVRHGALVSRHRPSVDVLFRSAASSSGPRTTGVLLTGMGSDGADGLLAIKRAGGATIAQDESTSVIFGMPREAIERGAAEQILALSEIPKALLRHRGNTRSPKALKGASLPSRARVTKSIS